MDLQNSESSKEILGVSTPESNPNVKIEKEINNVSADNAVISSSINEVDLQSTEDGASESVSPVQSVPEVPQIATPENIKTHASLSTDIPNEQQIYTSGNSTVLPPIKLSFSSNGSSNLPTAVFSNSEQLPASSDYLRVFTDLKSNSASFPPKVNSTDNAFPSIENYIENFSKELSDDCPAEFRPDSSKVSTETTASTSMEYVPSTSTEAQTSNSVSQFLANQSMQIQTVLQGSAGSPENQSSQTQTNLQQPIQLTIDLESLQALVGQQVQLVLPSQLASSQCSGDTTITLSTSKQAENGSVQVVTLPLQVNPAPGVGTQSAPVKLTQIRRPFRRDSKDPSIFDFPDEGDGNKDRKVKIALMESNSSNSVPPSQSTSEFPSINSAMLTPKEESDERKSDRPKYNVYKQIQNDIQMAHSRVYQCGICGNYAALSQETLDKHLRSHYQEKPYRCPHCDKGFRFQSLLNTHMHTHTGTKPHRCNDCDQAFVTKGELTRHERYRHTLIKPHKCRDCDYASVEISKLKRHMRSHTGDRPFKCHLCTYCCADNFKLKRHLKTHTGEKPYECPVCKARFTQSGSMKQHLLGHTGDKPRYQCEFCITTCGRKSDLKQHIIKLHTSDMPQKCKYCNCSFPDRFTLKEHLRNHKGEKVWQCDMCDYRCQQQRHLVSHRRVHTGEKPYVCSQCGQTFRVKQQLKDHIAKTHLDPEYQKKIKDKLSKVCPLCQRKLSSKFALKQHLRSVHQSEVSVKKKNSDEESSSDEDDEFYRTTQMSNGQTTMYVPYATPEGTQYIPQQYQSGYDPSTGQPVAYVTLPQDDSVMLGVSQNQQGMMMNQNECAAPSEEYVPIQNIQVAQVSSQVSTASTAAQSNNTLSTVDSSAIKPDLPRKTKIQKRRGRPLKNETLAKAAHT